MMEATIIGPPQTITTGPIDENARAVARPGLQPSVSEIERGWSRGRTTMGPDPSNEVIAVGIDGSIGSRRALIWALQHAREGDRVVLVHGWCDSPAMVEADLTARDDDSPARALLHHELTRAQLHPRAELLELGTHCREGSAAEALRDVGADVVVVGAHGHGLMDRLLGSSSSGLLQRPPCAVVVVP